MKIPVFAKMVFISLFFSVLSLALFLALLHAPGSTIYVYVVYMFIIIVGISFFVAGTITEPVNKLKKGFEELMKGETAAVKLNTGDELEELANAFNYTANVLFQQREELKKSREKYRNLVEEINDWVFELDEKLSGKKKDEERMRYLASIVENVVDAVISLDGEGKIVSWNRGAEKIFGFRAKDVVGKHYSILESLGTRVDGTKMQVDVTLTKVAGMYAVILRDITERKKAEEELRKAYVQLQEKTIELMRSKKELEHLANRGREQNSQKGAQVRPRKGQSLHGI